MRHGLLVLIVIFLSGCAQFQALNEKIALHEASNRLEEYNNFIDKELLATFYFVSTDGKTFGLKEDLKNDKFEFERMTNSSFSISKKMFTESNMQNMINSYSRYNYDCTSDAFSRMYIDFANSRGNKVCLYKPSMGKSLNSIFNPPFKEGQQRTEWYGLDNPLIELDHQNRIVSCLVRAHQAFTIVGVNSYQYATIYTGPGNARHIENNLPNSVFYETLIRELPPH